MVEIDEKKAKRLLNWGWNLLMLYVICVSMYIWQDSKSNPQDYLLVEERISVEQQHSNFQFGNEWMAEASTIEECKPLINLKSKWDSFGPPLIISILILGIIRILIDNKDRII